ncbi:arsenate reductase [Ectothiorhodospira lacustris]|uniref:arsenate reductase n=1 Tax=Ectothiorhodospira lacustris TaxID=2899127 RepID=UPI001EE7ABA0|nr:arsenate reductase [Ectothiorhodospira lacustris]MCG5509462.1 arsenate reductase [Ectothiorhodospira lacustris]MCG5521516.1 arsenate reductase [Ectothiorhodospira lacustris]
MSGFNAPHPCRLYGIRHCDTMKKALVWLDNAGIAHEFVDYKQAGIVADRLPHWCRQAGWEGLINRRGLTWRRLDAAAREALDEPRACALMMQHPTLIRRPILECGERVLVGFDVDRYREVLA